jgi:ribose-phosphate pyrophosphokinase
MAIRLDRLKVFAGNSGQYLAREICDELSIPLGKSRTLKFKNQNTFVQVEESVRDVDCYIVQCIGENINDDLMETLIMADALKRASARRITAVLPYFFYARSDKKDQPRVSITAKLVADLLTAAGYDRVVTMDMHSEQIMGFFNNPMDQLTAQPVITSYIRNKQLRNCVVVAPDAGGAKRARSYSWELNADLAIIDKRRIGNKDKTSIFGLIGDVKDRVAILVDDEIDTGGSIINSVRSLKEAGAKEVYAACTHPVFSADAVERLTQEEGLEEVIATNTIRIKKAYDKDKIKVLSVAPLLAQAILSIHEGRSVSDLFQRWDNVER